MQAMFPFPYYHDEYGQPMPAAYVHPSPNYHGYPVNLTPNIQRGFHVHRYSFQSAYMSQHPIYGVQQWHVPLPYYMPPSGRMPFNQEPLNQEPFNAPGYYPDVQLPVRGPSKLRGHDAKEIQRSPGDCHLQNPAPAPMLKRLEPVSATILQEADPNVRVTDCSNGSTHTESEIKPQSFKRHFTKPQKEVEPPMNPVVRKTLGEPVTVELSPSGIHQDDLWPFRLGKNYTGHTFKMLRNTLKKKADWALLPIETSNCDTDIDAKTTNILAAVHFSDPHHWVVLQTVFGPDGPQILYFDTLRDNRMTRARSTLIMVWERISVRLREVKHPALVYDKPRTMRIVVSAAGKALDSFWLTMTEQILPS